MTVIAPSLSPTQNPETMLLTLDTSPLELIIRATVVYFALYVTLRVVVKRQMGSVGIPDLLVIVLVADAVQNSMVGESKSILGGLIVAGTIIAWSYLLDVLAARVPALRYVILPQPLPLVKNGRFLRANMRRELVDEDELMSELRKKGVSSVKEVKSMQLESDGEFSVLKFDQSEEPDQSPKRKLA